MTQADNELSDISMELLPEERLLQTLLSDLGPDRSYELLRHPIQDWLKKVFMNRGGQKLEQAAPPYSIIELLGLASDEPAAHMVPPGNDHPELYTWNDQPLFYVYHPYSQIDEPALREFCRKLKLEYRISPDSWHFVGRTLRVTIFDPARAKAYWEAVR